ncbi:MAG: YbhB/YbcL family Raf kinase inhibitor-like protein [Desulfobacteraceae bacterium]|nr:MAG: YbhB/YbcL family Raf kinase inhibitor-like protein [Desulfobacteraceae bacterium]
MKLSSSAFKNNDPIPRKYTCQGEDVHPELIIEDIPQEAESLVLIVDDPDAPGKVFDHWVAYDIPVTGKIGEGAMPGTQGVNDFRKSGYGGPCPPSGTHRYFFKLYALDERLNLPEGLGKGDVQKAVQGHVLDQAELIGVYSKG